MAYHRGGGAYRCPRCHCAIGDHRDETVGGRVVSRCLTHPRPDGCFSAVGYGRDDRGRERERDDRGGRDGGRRRNPDELGALWEKKIRSGVMLSGFIEVGGERVDVVCFEVQSENPKAPAWRVMKSKPKDRGRDDDGFDDEPDYNPRERDNRREDGDDEPPL